MIGNVFLVVLSSEGQLSKETKNTKSLFLHLLDHHLTSVCDIADEQFYTNKRLQCRDDAEDRFTK